MTAAYHQYLVLAIPADHPHLFQAILSNTLKTNVGIIKWTKTWKSVAKSWEIGLKVQKVWESVLIAIFAVQMLFVIQIKMIFFDVCRLLP